MYAALVSNGDNADWTDRQTDRLSNANGSITFSARRGQHKNNAMACGKWGKYECKQNQIR